MSAQVLIKQRSDDIAASQRLGAMIDSRLQGVRRDLDNLLSLRGLNPLQTQHVELSTDRFGTSITNVIDNFGEHVTVAAAEGPMWGRK